MGRIRLGLFLLVAHAPIRSGKDMRLVARGSRAMGGGGKPYSHSQRYDPLDFGGTTRAPLHAFTARCHKPGAPSPAAVNQRTVGIGARYRRLMLMKAEAALADIKGRINGSCQ